MKLGSNNLKNDAHVDRARRRYRYVITASWNGGMAQSARLDVSATRISADRLRNRVPLVSLHLSYTEMAVVVYIRVFRPSRHWGLDTTICCGQNPSPTLLLL